MKEYRSVSTGRYTISVEYGKLSLFEADPSGNRSKVVIDKTTADVLAEVMTEMERLRELVESRSEPEPVAKNAVEALAESWASIDGRLDKFKAGEGLSIQNQPGAYYSGYVADAESLIKRLDARGFVLIEKKT